MKLRNQCLRHRRYPNKEVAERELIKSIHKYKINLVRAYECHYCRGYHLTSSNG